MMAAIGSLSIGRTVNIEAQSFVQIIGAIEGDSARRWASPAASTNSGLVTTQKNSGIVTLKSNGGTASHG
jgi:hypothetical protein